MYEVVYDHEKWWISKDNRIIRELGGFIDPLTPKIILKELKNGQGNVEPKRENDD